MKITSKVLLFSLAASLTFFACKKSKSNNTQTVTTQDRAFISKASLSNTAEVRAGALADSTSDSSVVRAFGQQMVTDHSTAQTDLKILGSNLSVAVTDSVDSMHAALIDTLRGLSGRMFDSVYIMNQIKDHQTAITDFQNEINEGNQSDVVGYANKYLPKLQMHLQMADSIASLMKFK
jgi:putative membrane protein